MCIILLVAPQSCEQNNTSTKKAVIVYNTVTITSALDSPINSKYIHGLIIQIDNIPDSTKYRLKTTAKAYIDYNFNSSSNFIGYLIVTLQPDKKLRNATYHFSQKTQDNYLFLITHGVNVEWDTTLAKEYSPVVEKMQKSNLLQRRLILSNILANLRQMIQEEKMNYILLYREPYKGDADNSEKDFVMPF